MPVQPTGRRRPYFVVCPFRITALSFADLGRLLGPDQPLYAIQPQGMDTDAPAHHSVEDTGLALGQAIDEALGDRSGIRRFGHAVVPMDEARASCAIDVSGRPYTAFEGSFPAERVADFDTDLAEEFVRAVANAAKLTVHVSVEAGSNAHHMVEASFKAFARALREAVSEDPRVQGVPSTKGLL